MPQTSFTNQINELNRVQNDYAALSNISSLLKDFIYENAIDKCYQQDICNCAALIETISNKVRLDALQLAHNTLRIV